MTDSVTNQPKHTFQDAAAASLQKPAFDPIMHQPPRIDEFGFNALPKMRLNDDGKNILKDQTIQVPDWWKDGKNEQNCTIQSNGQKVKTNTELQDARRKQRIPDISFDLDGDGNVGGRDFVISKLFDKDGDGKLNAEERRAAEEAVRNVS